MPTMSAMTIAVAVTPDTRAKGVRFAMGSLMLALVRIRPKRSHKWGKFNRVLRALTLK